MAEYQIAELLESYGKRVFNLAYRLTGNRQDAEDVTQDTFLQVHRGLDRFRGDSHIYTWIYRIVVNNSLRLKGRPDRAFVDSLDDTIEQFRDDIPDEVRQWTTDPEKRCLYDELLREIRKECYRFMTFRLTDDQRVVYVLRVMLGLSLDDISGVLKIDKNTVKARLHRAKRNLRSHFHNRCEWTDGEVRCSCGSRVGFAVVYAPDIIRRLLNTPPDEITKRMVSSTIGSIENIDEIYRSLPMEEYKTDLLLEYLKGA